MQVREGTVSKQHSYCQPHRYVTLEDTGSQTIQPTSCIENRQVYRSHRSPCRKLPDIVTMNDSPAAVYVEDTRQPLTPTPVSAPHPVCFSWLATRQRGRPTHPVIHPRLLFAEPTEWFPWCRIFGPICMYSVLVSLGKTNTHYCVCCLRPFHVYICLMLRPWKKRRPIKGIMQLWIKTQSTRPFQ